MRISVESHVYSSVEIGGRSVPFVTDAVIVMWIVTALIILLSFLFTRKLNKVPKGPQILLETLVNFVNNLTYEKMHHHGKYFSPYICTVLLFLGLMNPIAIFNIIPSGEFLAAITGNHNLEHFELLLEAPTRNFNVTLCLALITIFLVIFAEFKFKGFMGWLRGFYKPNPIYGFVKILDYIVRPMSLCLRLFGTILGGFVAMSLIYSAMPIALPAAVSVYFDLFDGLLHAYVFIFLSVMYLAEAVEEPEEVK